MKVFYVVEYSDYQRKNRHFLFLHEPAKIGNMYNEPKCAESPSFIEILEENLPASIHNLAEQAKKNPIEIRAELFLLQT